MIFVNPFFRHASVSTTYPGPSVILQISILSASLRPHKAPRRHCGTEMVADMEVDKVAEMVANIAADMTKIKYIKPEMF